MPVSAQMTCCRSEKKPAAAFLKRWQTWYESFYNYTTLLSPDHSHPLFCAIAVVPSACFGLSRQPAGCPIAVLCLWAARAWENKQHPDKYSCSHHILCSPLFLAHITRMYMLQHVQIGHIQIQTQQNNVHVTHTLYIKVSASHEKSPTELTLRQHPSSRSSSTFSFCVWGPVCATLACWQVSKWAQRFLGQIQNGPCQVDQKSSRTNRASSWHKPTRSPVRRPQVGNVRMSEK